MAIRVGINGFGRMGRLALRAAWEWPEFEIVHINEIAGRVATSAHLLNFDSIHGRWHHEAAVDKDHINIGNKSITFSQNEMIESTPWKNQAVELVIEASGKYKSKAALLPYFKQGIKKVVVSAPIKSDVLNIVMGINDQLYESEQHHIVTAASCTTNCLAPIVQVIDQNLGIKHGCLTTIHAITNSQSILDSSHKDMRRARASSVSLIPTTTGSARAISMIFPKLRGKLDGLAVRVPLANASLIDCVFEVEQITTVDEVNALFQRASQHALKGILGYETRPLVSVDYTNDPRSSIIDAQSTMVIDDTQVKVLAWYDNEIGYVNRMMELAKIVALSI